MLSLILTACGGSGGGSTAPAQVTPTKVLFIGNSYITVNDLPLMVERLAASAGIAVETERNAPGGNTLGAPQISGDPHMSNPVTLALIASDDWDFVVLQEESTMPTITLTKDQFTKPAAQSLAAAIQANDPSTETVLFQTWGRKNGGQFCWGGSCSPVFTDFFAMQDSLTSGYAEVEALVGASVAPVGEAWRTSKLADPTLDLHEPDESHPSVAGSYLAACVFYATFTGQSPVGLPYDAGLAPATAAFLQQAAWDTIQTAPLVVGPPEPLPLFLTVPALPQPVLVPLIRDRR